MTTPADREIVHIAGLDVIVGTQLRQRCAWCGAVIDDTDLSGIQVALQPGETEAAPYPSWPVGALIGRIDGATYVIKHEKGAALPDGCCAKLDPAVTV
jgi:hypothetical protein